jgi:hypothetical protein
VLSDVDLLFESDFVSAFLSPSLFGADPFFA